MTPREWLKWGEAELSAGPHAEKAARDAEFLLLHQAGKNHAWLLAHGDEEFGGSGAEGYAALIERRRAGEPVQYIVGEAEFFGLPLKVTPDVLIPRPETELLVEAAIEIARRNQLLRIVDICTGSGAIAIALARALPDVSIVATDISAKALAVARENAARNQSSIRFLEGDLLAPLDGEPISLIVSNPPYVPEADRASLSVEVREHEPGLALFAGADGLDVYRRLIPAAFAALVENGWLLMEIGFGERKAVEQLMRAAGFDGVEASEDLNGIPRVVEGRRTR